MLGACCSGRFFPLVVIIAVTVAYQWEQLSEKRFGAYVDGCGKSLYYVDKVVGGADVPMRSYIAFPEPVFHHSRNQCASESNQQIGFERVVVKLVDASVDGADDVIALNVGDGFGKNHSPRIVR